MEDSVNKKKKPDDSSTLLNREEKLKDIKRKRHCGSQRAYYQRQKGLTKNGEKKKETVPKSNVERQRKFRQRNREKRTSSIQSGENHSQEATSQLLSTSNDSQSQSKKATQIGQTSLVSILRPHFPPTKDSPSTGVEDILISLGKISRGSILPSQFPPTSHTKENNVEDVPISSRETSRGGILLSQFSSIKDSKQTKVEDVPIVSRQASQLHPTSSTNGQLHGVEDVRTVRQPNKKPRLNEDILESFWGTERDILLKLIAEERREDDVDLFFKSIAASVKKLRPDLIHEAKMKCLQMIFDLENRASVSSNEKRFNFAPEPSRSPSPNSILSSPSSVENNITIKTEIDES